MTKTKAPLLTALVNHIDGDRMELIIHLSKALDSRIGYYCDPSYIDVLLELYGKPKMNVEENYYMARVWFEVKQHQKSA
jgi:hypothetical protein